MGARVSQSKTARKTKAYLVYGDDAFRVAEQTEKIVSSLVAPEDRVLGLEILNGRVENAAGAIEVVYKCREALLTPAFMGGGKTVWLREASFVGSTQTALAKNVVAAVKALAQTVETGFADGVSLIISANAVEARSPLLAAFKNAGGDVKTFSAPKPWDEDKVAMDFLKEFFSARGAQADREALKTFVGIVGSDLRVYEAEIEKLLLFIQPRMTVDARDVLNIAAPLRSSEPWEFLDSVSMRDLPAAIAHARRLMFQKTAPIQLVTSLYGRFRTLAVLSELMRSGALVRTERGVEWRDPDGGLAASLENAFGTGEGAGRTNPMKMNLFRVRILADQARLYAPRELEKALEWITKAREDIVGSRKPESLVMDLLLVKICGRARR